jgi:hypothetical protein
MISRRDHRSAASPAGRMAPTSPAERVKLTTPASSAEWVMERTSSG